MKARAETLDGDAVEGYVLTIGNSYYISTNTPAPTLKYGGDYHLDVKVFKINPSTLEYRVGSDWYSMEDLEEAIDYMNEKDILEIRRFTKQVLKDNK